MSTLIGYGSPNKADTHDVHGAPLGASETAATREQLNWPYGEFEVPQEAYAEFAKSAARGAEAHKKWEEVRAAYAAKYPEEYAEYESISTGKLPDNWAEKLPKFTSAGARARKWARSCGLTGAPGLPGCCCARRAARLLRCQPAARPPLLPPTLPCPEQTTAWPPACTARPCSTPWPPTCPA